MCNWYKNSFVSIFKVINLGCSSMDVILDFRKKNYIVLEVSIKIKFNGFFVLVTMSYINWYSENKREHFLVKINYKFFCHFFIDVIQCYFV